MQLGATGFDFLILDWMLPGKSGVEFVPRIRAQPNGDEMFILLVTARPTPRTCRRALEAGANDYLTKPLDLGLLNVRLSVGRTADSRSRGTQSRARRAPGIGPHARKHSREHHGRIFRRRSEWKFTHLNPEAEILLRRKREELYRRGALQKFPGTDGISLRTQLSQGDDGTGGGGIRGPGQRGKIWFEVRAYPSDGGVSVFFHDISERKRTKRND